MRFGETPRISRRLRPRVALDVAERRRLALALGQPLAHALHEVRELGVVVEHRVDVGLDAELLESRRGSTRDGLRAPDLVDRPAVGGVDEEAGVVLDLLAVGQAQVEAVPGLVVERVEVEVVELPPGVT